MNRIALFIVVGTALCLGFYLRGCLPPREDASMRADTVYVDRPLLVRDTVRQEVPVRVTVFERVEVEKLRVDTVARPVSLERYTLAPPRPLQFRRGHAATMVAIVTTFDPEAGRWQQASYAVPVKRWDVSVTSSLLWLAHTEQGSGSIAATVAPAVRVGRVRVEGGVVVPLHRVEEGSSSVGLRPFGRLTYTLPVF